MNINWGNILAGALKFGETIAAEIGGNVVGAVEGGAKADVSTVANAAKSAVIQTLTANNGLLTTDAAAAAEAAVTSVPGGAAFAGLIGPVVSALAAKELATFEAHNQGLTKAGA